MNLYFYKVKSAHIVDGDTVDLVVDTGFRQTIYDRFRLDGYDAPETWRPVNEVERSAGKLVTAELSRIIEDNKDRIFVQSLSSRADIYARWSCNLFYMDPKADNLYVSINDIISKFIIDNHFTKTEVRAVS